MTGGGPDANFTYWNGIGWASTEGGGAFGFGGITAYNPISGTLLPVYGFTGGDLGSVGTGNLLGLGDRLYGAAAYGGIGQHGVGYALQTCTTYETYQPLAINAAVFNPYAMRLKVIYTGNSANSSPFDPTTQMWGTLYNGSSASSPLDTFRFSTPGGGMFTGSQTFHLDTMPSSISLSYSGLCGASTLSASVPVSLAPTLNYETLSDNQIKVSWDLNSSLNYRLQYSLEIGRHTEWSYLTSPAPVLKDGVLSVTVTPGMGNLFLRLSD
jgi:hypothetical protein